ncbi:hypothetical protein BCR44DRAFT_1427602 [Catenaria anguillulae PL171]|uniref:WD40-repeat-containing domain protein n=1 Tax=Catenaria anguillulae PL171 TaxID=765915 RepID=A0A1Y2HXK4_9FUNG|nr:hypothetical protein BCR44DRAFT_1427602 [Catenaria anguillulae PL171]
MHMHVHLVGSPGIESLPHPNPHSLFNRMAMRSQDHLHPRQRRFSSPHVIAFPPSSSATSPLLGPTSHSHPANMDVHLHPLAEHETPLGLKHMEVHLGGFHVQLQEDAHDNPAMSTTLVATAFDPANGAQVDQASIQFHPPISSTNLASATTAAAAAAAARSPSVTMWPSPNIAELAQSQSVMRKRKRSVGSASSLGLDTNDSTVAISLSSPMGLPSGHSLELHQLPHNHPMVAASAMELATPTSSVFPSSTAAAGPSTVGAGSTVMFARPRSPLAVADRMEVDFIHAAEPSTTHAPTSKPVKKRVKSIEASNANLAFMSPSTALSAGSATIHSPAATLPNSALLHQSAATPPPAANSTAATHSGETPRHLFHRPQSTRQATWTLPRRLRLVAAHRVPLFHVPSASPTRGRGRRATSSSAAAVPHSLSTSPAYAPAAAPLSRLHALPHWVAHLDDLPEPLVHYALFQLLRRCSVTTLQFVHGIVAPALKRDFLALGGSGSMLRVRSMYQIARIQMARHEPLTKEIAPDLLPFLDKASVRRIVENLECYLDPRDVLAHVGAHPFKAMYARGRTLQGAWMSKEPKRIAFTGHGSAVLVSGSDDQTICVYDIRTGQLRRRLDGHEGGVWALQYVGNTLVSGSTDRTTTHVFHGHTSTVRCKRPPAGTVHVGTPYKGGYISSATFIGHAPTPKLTEPLIVTGSRDTHVRVWRLPEPTDPAGDGGDGDGDRLGAMGRKKGRRSSSGFATHGPEGSSATPVNSAHDLPGATAMDGSSSSSHQHHPHPSANPYFRHVLAGHAHSVRALAGHGHIVCSGSYDSTVRVWDVVSGTCMWQLTGHTTKVYSIVYDGVSKCWSGSMDATVRCWDVHTGQCLAVLEGHSSLVGLLELSPQWLVSAAADSSLRVWNTEDSALVHTLQAHSNAITCFHFDAHKVVSGSEGAIKLWDPKTGKVVRDLVTNVANVWRLQVNERWTEFIVLDFDPGVDCPAFDGTVPFTPTAGAGGAVGGAPPPPSASHGSSSHVGGGGGGGDEGWPTAGTHRGGATGSGPTAFQHVYRPAPGHADDHQPRSSAATAGVHQHHRYHPYAVALTSAAASPASSSSGARRHSASSAMLVDDPVVDEQDDDAVDAGSPMVISSPNVPPPPSAASSTSASRQQHHGRGASSSSSSSMQY